MNAIFIDSVNQKLVPIELDVTKDLLTQYYELIGNNCKCVEAPYQFNDSEILLVDEEGLFNNAQSGFRYPDWNYPIVGNGIIVGVDNESGDSISISSPIEAFKDIIWCDKFEIKAHISKMLGSFTDEADIQALKKMANYELIQVSKDLKNDKLPKDSLAAKTISNYFGVEIDDLDDSHFLAFQFILSSELALRLEDCMSSY